MSMNLVFDVKNNPHGMVDFPFQTSSELTRDVLDEPCNNKRIEIIRSRITEYGWDSEDIDRIMSEVITLINCDTLELSII